MNLIQKLKIWKELKRLEARVRQTPAPSTFVDLGQVYINLGMHERTLVLAEEGLALFPQSNELRKLRRFANKNRLNSRIREIREELAKAASPEHYQELASLYLELGDLEAVQSACEECLRRFPSENGVHMVLGRAALTSFYRDLTARAGIVAVDHLRKLLKQDPEHAAAHRLIAEVAFRIGAFATARRHIDELCRLDTVDDEVAAMRDEIGDPPRDEDIEALFHAVERRGQLARGPVIQGGASPAPSADGSASIVRDTLGQIAAMDGVRKAAYFRGSKALVRGDIKDGQDAFLRIARVVARAAQRAARRMDIGNFNKGVVDVGGSRICLCSYGEVLAAVECDDSSATEVVLDELQELVAGSLVAGERITS